MHAFFYAYELFFVIVLYILHTGYSGNHRMAVNSLVAHFATPAAILILEFLPFHPVPCYQIDSIEPIEYSNTAGDPKLNAWWVWYDPSAGNGQRALSMVRHVLGVSTVYYPVE